MKKIVGVAILVMVSIAGIFTIISFTGNSVKEISEDNAAKLEGVKEFTIKAYRFGYSPDVVEVNKGDRVKIAINNTDTLHGIRIPELELKGEYSLEFTADEEGEFEWYCTVMCGDGHKNMKGKLIIK